MTENKKPSHKKPAKNHQETKASTTVSPRSSSARLFWGALLILLGGLALADTMDILQVELANIWRLWPLVIVGLGVSILSLEKSAGRLIRGLFMVAVLIAVFLAAVAPVVENGNSQVAVAVEEGVEHLVLEYRGGAGTTAITTRDDTDMIDASLTGSTATLEHSQARDGDRQTVQLRANHPHMMGWWASGWKNDVILQIPEAISTDLLLKMGAGKLEVDTVRAQIEKLELDLGASSADVRLGAMAERSEVFINAGASSITLHVPESSGVEVALESGVGSTRLPGLENIEGNLYRSADFDAADEQVVIRGSLGAASFNLVRY